MNVNVNLKVKTYLLLLFLVPLLSCSSAEVKRETRTAFQLRPYQEETLPNGLRLLFIKDTSLPRLSFQMMVRAGALDEPRDLAGLNALVAELMDQGTKTKSATQIAEDFALIGAEFQANPSEDYTFLTSSGIAIYGKELVSLFADVVTQPAFSPAEIHRVKAHQLAEIQKAQDEPDSFADELLAKEVFPDHPYGYPGIGTKEGLQKIKRENILAHYGKFYRPGQAILAVVGSFDEGLVHEIRERFSRWEAGPPVPPPAVAQSESSKGTMKLISKKGLQQTQIRMGHLGIRRVDPDYLSLRAGNLILGGGFYSRLNQRVRDDLALTYGIFSSSDARADRGLFEINTASRNEKSADTIQETLAVLKDFVEKGVNDNEVTAAKTLMIGQFPSAIETVDRLATNLLILRRYGVADDYLSKYEANVNRLTTAEINDSIRRHIRPGQINTLVYADRDQVLRALEKLGPWTVEEIH
ncbi:MAG: insulinase family protein [Bdellovibrio sp.]|nr:MAG: insulinase family protein [Bdellovibrio sp.]